MKGRMRYVAMFYAWPRRTWELGQSGAATLVAYHGLMRKLGRES